MDNDEGESLFSFADGEKLSRSEYQEIFGSDDDQEDFDGFSFRDQRRFFKETSSTEVFSTTVTQRKQISENTRSSGEPSERKECDNANYNFKRKLSDSDIEGEIAEDVFQYTVRTFTTRTESESSDSSIEGEASWEIEKSLTDNCVSSHSDDEKGASTSCDVAHLQEASSKTKLCKTKAKKRSSIRHPRDVANNTPHCCKDDCLKKLTEGQILKAREMFLNSCPSYFRQRQYVLDWLESNHLFSGDFAYHISGVKTCYTAWITVLGIPRRTFFNWKRDFLNGRLCADHGNSLVLKTSPATEAVVNFLENFFEENCDYMPTGNLMHLPSSFSKCDIFEEMKEVLGELGQPCPSEALFAKVWKERFPQVKIPKDDRFSKCDTCCNIIKDLQSIREKHLRIAVFKRRTGHREFARNERTAYMKRASQAHRCPQKFFSVAIDGMDQSKTELPFSKHRHKSLDTAWKLKIHVVGAMVHGRPPIVFLDYQQHQHDSNLTCNLLLQVFWIHRGYLPNHVFVQLDNTYRDNKNQYLMGLMAYLVETGIFDTVEVAFLPKGHTHIDVDQLFSRLSVAIGKNGCLTFQDLKKLLQICYRQTQGDTTQEGAGIQHAQVDQIFAIREWLIPHIEEIHGLLNHHHFKFTRNPDGKCVLDYKPWCKDEFDKRKWPPITPLKRIPEGVPELVVPDYRSVDFKRLKKMVERCQKVGVLDDEEVCLWSEFLDAEEIKEKILDDVEKVVYSKENGNQSKSHKPGLTYMGTDSESWIVDDLRERERPDIKTTPHLSDVLKNSEALEIGDGLLPVYTGSYQSKERQKAKMRTDAQISSLEEGMMVALNLEKYPETPQIAKVLSITGDDVEVQWYHGTWTGPWRVHKVRNGRNMVENKETVSRDAIKLFNFTLTPMNNLRNLVKEKLKAIYEN